MRPKPVLRLLESLSVGLSPQCGYAGAEPRSPVGDLAGKVAGADHRFAKRCSALPKDVAWIGHAHSPRSADGAA